MSIRDRKSREKKEMRKLILDAAIELFVEEGFENVSTRRIADKIEYSSATIYTYFTDKSEIFFELHKIGFDLLYRKQVTVQEIEEPVERLCQHGKAYLEFSLEYPQYYDIMFIMKISTIDANNATIWEYGERSYNILEKNVSECKNAGFFRNQSVEEISFLLWSLVHGIASLQIRRRLILGLWEEGFYEKLIDDSAKLLKVLIR